MSRMKERQEIFLEETELSAPRMPPRSRLYPLVPVGVGTPYTESLTSYITRLADAHCVTTKVLVLRELFPRLNKLYLQRYGLGICRRFGTPNRPGSTAYPTPPKTG